MGEGSVLNASHGRIHHNDAPDHIFDRLLDMGHLADEAAADGARCGVVAVVAVRRLVFYAKWIAYSRRADKIADFIVKADRRRRMPVGPVWSMIREIPISIFSYLERRPMYTVAFFKKIKDLLFRRTSLAPSFRIQGSWKSWVVNADRGAVPARFPTPDRSKWLHRPGG